MMDLRLAYRVVTHGQAVVTPPRTWDFPPGPAEERQLLLTLAERLTGEARAIAAAPKLTLDNVAAWYAASPQQHWDIRTDIPCWAPPWPQFWAEWNEPEEWAMPDGAHRWEERTQIGYFVTALPADPGRLAWVRTVIQAFAHTQSLPELTDDWLAASMAGCRWVLCCDAWSTTGAAPVHGKPVWVGMAHFAFVREDGTLHDLLTAGVRLRQVSARDPNYVSPMHILGLGLSFCHCKNVARQERADDRGDRFHGRGRRGPQVPVLKFTTLDIGPMREVIRREGREAEQGPARALHDVRGHFAYYGEDKPLFGRPGLSGRFWIPKHERGSPQAGAVVKDYRVSPGEG